MSIKKIIKMTKNKKILWDYKMLSGTKECYCSKFKNKHKESELLFEIEYVLFKKSFKFFIKSKKKVDKYFSCEYNKLCEKLYEEILKSL